MALWRLNRFTLRLSLVPSSRLSPAIALLFGIVPSLVGAQEPDEIPVRARRAAFDWGARAIPLITRASATPGGRTLTQAYLSQPVIMAGLAFGWMRVAGTLDLEGLTLRRGELTHGAWGEGYVDRRHPHSYVHEAMIGLVTPEVSRAAASVFAGRGYVPFGSDDPMMRPFAAFPGNHHLAQIVERLVVVGAVRYAGVMAEGAVFNGDEPIDPAIPPLARRFGDSWSTRATLTGAPIAPSLDGVELAASYAFVKSPEFREGNGLDQRKAHVGLRLGASTSPYALVEWARTVDLDRGRALYTFNSLLAEGAMCRRGGGGVALRVEQSERPEEERLVDLFRSARPATDNSIVGVTRWTTWTAAMSFPGVGGAAGIVAPFVEVARIAVHRASAGAFDPSLLYGGRDGWRMSAGARLVAGRIHDRMGRYGAAQSATSAPTPHTHSRASREQRCFP